jgi:glycosyltransferase involved in cell wall biosynthesis
VKVWLIQLGEILPIKSGTRKMRTALLADELTKRGHSVLWWASAFEHLTKTWVCYWDCEYVLHDKFKIIALKGIGYKKNVSLQRYIDQKILARKFRRAIPLQSKPDIIIASLPTYDLAYVASVFAQKNNIPIIVDIRDPWPEIFLDHIPSPLRYIAKTLLHRDFMKVQRTLRSATSVVSMMARLLNWGLEYAGREMTWRDSVFYLGYKRDTSSEQSSRIEEMFQKIKSKFIVCFIGSFAEYHDPSILVQCATKLQAEKDIHFVLAGDGELMAEISENAKSLENLTLTGWLDQSEISTLLRHSDVGVCPTKHESYFFPNKAFAYFSANLPIISAFQGDIKDLIEKHHIGMYYSPNDLNGLTNCIKELYNNTSMYEKMSINVRNVFDHMFGANKIYKRYVDLIERIVQE